MKLGKDQDQQALAHALHLLGADVTLVTRKDALRTEQTEIEDLRRFMRSSDTRLQQLLRSDVAPQTTVQSLSEQIEAIRSRLANMQIAEDYETIRAEADRLTGEARDLEEQIALIEYRLSGINDALQQRADIDRETLLAFYNGMQDVFRPEALRHFEQVESFHRSLAEQRRVRLERDRLRLQSQREEVIRRHSEVVLSRDAMLAQLAGRHALDEYQAVVVRLAALEEDRRRLSQFIDAEQKLESRRLEVRRQLAEEDGRAASYVAVRPLSWADERFRLLIHQLYPREAAGITLENNTGTNRLRYNLHVQVQGQGSDGINAVRVICFDWLLFMNGAHHNIGHLWHDNGLFDPVDPHQRAAWFDLVRRELSNTGKQYIVSINTENFESTLRLSGAETRAYLDDSVIIRLHGDRPSGKLLGVQFGANPD